MADWSDPMSGDWSVHPWVATLVDWSALMSGDWSEDWSVH